MAEMTTKIPISSVTKEMVMHVEVTGVRGFGLRLSIAKALIWLAAKISGMGVRFENVGSYSKQVVSECPITYWKMDKQSGESANDSSGNRRDGTYTINTEGMINSPQELERKLRERLK